MNEIKLIYLGYLYTISILMFSRVIQSGNYAINDILNNVRFEERLNHLIDLRCQIWRWGHSGHSWWVADTTSAVN